MFVPVSCTSCGKPFQVPEAALGQLAPCPWCSATVTALPVSAPIAAPEPPAPEPLSLDDAAPAPPTKAARDREPTAGQEPWSPPAPTPLRNGPLLTVLGVLVLMLVVAGATMLVLGYSGRVSDSNWAEFTSADGSFTVALPGQPTESDVEPVPDGSLQPGKRYEVRRWYARTAAWVAYNDLEPGLAKKLADDGRRVVAAGVIRVARDREVTRLQGSNIKEGAEVRMGDGWGGEVSMDTPSGPAVVRFVALGTGPHPRLYVYGVQGKGVTGDGPLTRRLFSSFRVNN